MTDLPLLNPPILDPGTMSPTVPSPSHVTAENFAGYASTVQLRKEDSERERGIKMSQNAQTNPSPQIRGPAQT